jgi:hypothetical protein
VIRCEEKTVIADNVARGTREADHHPPVPGLEPGIAGVDEHVREHEGNLDARSRHRPAE